MKSNDRHNRQFWLLRKKQRYLSCKDILENLREGGYIQPTYSIDCAVRQIRTLKLFYGKITVCL